MKFISRASLWTGALQDFAMRVRAYAMEVHKQYIPSNTHQGSTQQKTLDDMLLKPSLAT